ARGLRAVDERTSSWTACRSATMPCCRTAVRRRWSAGPARWTGCASRGSTRPPPSPASSTSTAGASRSGRQGTSGASRGARDEASRAYLDQTMVLETTFRTAAGTAVLTDAMAVGRNERGHDLGAGSPGVLLRQLACTDGEMEVEVSYAPRPEYGLIHPILEETPGGVTARGGADRLLLSGPADLRVDGATATARLRIMAGQMVSFALQHGQMAEPPLTAWDAGEIAARLEDTLEGWRSWSAIHQTYEGPWRDLVHHSGRVLQALT